MPTTLLRSATRSVAIAAPVDAVHGFVAEPRNLPAWAPRFAQTVWPDGTSWLVEGDDGAARIDVRASGEHGTVDWLAAGQTRSGAFARVLPNGRGSELQFTRFFAPDAAEDEVAAAMAVVEDELERVREVTEAAERRTVLALRAR